MSVDIPSFPPLGYALTFKPQKRLESSVRGEDGFPESINTAHEVRFAGLSRKVRRYTTDAPVASTTMEQQYTEAINGYYCTSGYARCDKLQRPNGYSVHEHGWPFNNG